MSEYQPELGQFLNGQPWQHLDCPDYLDRAIRVMADLWDAYRDDPNPFSNTGAHVKNNIFTIHAYDWSDMDENPENFQKFNLAWSDVRISWYKYAGRGMSVNQPMSMFEVRLMIAEFLGSIGDFKEDA